MKKILGAVLFHYSRVMYIMSFNTQLFAEKQSKYYSDMNYKVDKDYELFIYKRIDIYPKTV